MLTLAKTIATLGGGVVECGLEINSRAANLFRVQVVLIRADNFGHLVLVITQVEPGVGGVHEVVAHPPTRDRGVAS